MKVSAYLDRFEGDLAVLYLGDDMKKVNFPRQYLPPEVSDGDYLQLDISYDEQATKQAEQEALDLLNDEK